MAYLGKAKKKHTCAICKSSIVSGDFVYHDPLKSINNSIVHENCWVKLTKSRGILSLLKKKVGKKSSDVELDPPF